MRIFDLPLRGHFCLIISKGSFFYKNVQEVHNTCIGMNDDGKWVPSGKGETCSTERSFVCASVVDGKVIHVYNILNCVAYLLYCVAYILYIVLHISRNFAKNVKEEGSTTKT